MLKASLQIHRSITSTIFKGKLLFNIDTGSALSVNEQKNLGDASVINNGLLTISTERSWAMTHSISGSGDVTKLGTGILTLNNDSAAYQGTTDIVGGGNCFRFRLCH